ncbi:MAG: TRAP transporter substrate-binding protein [Deltaproteobacteria bacterium]|nr:MAG: TRAP transporter substrate-binding protein [Deltaproteobacteria bacterium]
MKRFFVIPMFVVFLSGLILGAAAAPALAEKAIELKLSHMDPAGSKVDKLYHRWAKKMNKETNGRLNIRVIPGAVLVNAFETYQGVEKGVADIGGSFRYSRKGAELTGLISMFFAGIPNGAISTRILDEIREKFPAYNQEWQGAKELFLIAIGPATLVTKKKPLSTLEDIKGQQIRVPVREAADYLKALGGTPVGMPMSELLISMQKGTVDGASVQLYAIQSFKIAPVAKYCTLFSLYNPSNYFAMMNWDRWNKLPPDIQKVIDDSRGWFKREMVAAYDDGDAGAIGWAKKQGMKFTTLSPAERKRWFSIIGPVQDQQAAALDAKGYPATAVLKFVRERMDAYIK